MEAFLVATGVVAIAELGDKTQLLALALAARFERPRQVLLGVLAATLANHALAALLGRWVGTALDADVLRGALCLSFLGMAVWMLLPDNSSGAARVEPKFGVFVTTALAFFLLEMGDKTQVATVALAAEYVQTGAVIAGTTLGMMTANVPCVLMGRIACAKLPQPLLRKLAASVFVAVAAAAAWPSSGA